MHLSTRNQGNLASIEHLYSRMDIRRHLGSPLVAAHYKCNQDRADEESRKLYEGYTGKGIFRLDIKDFLK